jgi:hypothetical protein
MLEISREFDLQLFASEADEDDDEEVPDAFSKLVNEINADTDTDDEELEEEESSGEEGEEGGQEGEAAGEEPPAQQGQGTKDPNDVPKFSQNDVNRIIGQARIKGREIEDMAARIQAETGLSLVQVYEEIRRLREDEYVRKSTEEGYKTEEEARTEYRTQAENQALKNKVQYIQQQQRFTQSAIQYTQDKNQFYANPNVKKSVKDLARRYEPEIDQLFNQLTAGGTVCDYNALRTYVLGSKLEQDNILEAVQSGAEAKTLANVNKRKAASPEGAAQSGGTGISVSPLEKGLAREFGVSLKDLQAQKAKIAKERKRK